jgi:hypothetical protein
MWYRSHGWWVRIDIHNSILIWLAWWNESTVDVSILFRYLNKILEAVSLILSSHWHRIESNADHTEIILFVSSFFKLSFHPINRQSYQMCLEIWCTFLEYLTMRDVAHKQQFVLKLSLSLRHVGFFTCCETIICILGTKTCWVLCWKKLYASFAWNSLPMKISK